MAREEFRFFYPLRVRWSECDPQGVLFTGGYLHYLEVGMQEYFRHLGLNLYRVAQRGLFDTMVAQVKVEFRASAHLDDLVELGVRVGELRNRSFLLLSELFRPPEPQPLTLIEAHYVTVDTRNLRPIPVPPDVRKLVEHFEATGQRLPIEEFPNLRE